MVGPRLRRTLGERRLPRNLGDDAPSIADLFLAPIAFWVDKTAEAAQVTGGLTALADWRGRMEARPTFAAAE